MAPEDDDIQGASKQPDQTQPDQTVTSKKTFVEMVGEVIAAMPGTAGLSSELWMESEEVSNLIKEANGVVHDNIKAVDGEWEEYGKILAPFLKAIKDNAAAEGSEKESTFAAFLEVAVTVIRELKEYKTI